MLLPILITLFSQFQGLNGQAVNDVDANGITLLEKIEEMERQILNPFTLVSVVTPCGVNFNDNQNRGQQTSAEWVRIIFHDSITANIAGPGLGGLDASIGFESDRPENVGIFVNVTLGQFSQFSSVFLSMSDLIGVGLSDSLASCDPTARRIPLRVGRIDATGPGPAGVPGPTDNIEFATAAFAKAGFSQSEMIQAVACGHSLGGVHHTNFPDIVEDPKDASNTDGRAPFDSTPAIFDNTGVNEYLTGTGLKGGPLVVGPEATRSDLRIFASDDNATISAMSSPQSFEDTCFTIFEKMINTVPSAVKLSDPIVPRPWILRESHLDLNSAGAVTFSGTIIGHSSASLPDTASYSYGTSGGNTAPKTSQAGVAYPIVANTPIGFGTITDYNFADTLNNPDVTSINVQSSYSAPINQKIFILVSQGFHNQIRDSNNAITVNQQYVVRAAILISLAPAGTVLSAKLWHTAAQAGSIVPKILSTTVSMTLKTTLGSYAIYQAVVTVGDGVSALPGGTMTFQVTSGATLASAKVDPGNWPACTNDVLTSC
ncbi:uncharacterized protein BP5553_06507 [Venustampulla echinocandica]|uniref:Peroxidase n=1 Tax=Venustampulla echinocandica TaxID=2656787 RepID=A0A370TK48_9HELO|nr:uncharacterized protein BP5553_06507 [Venustampulla echinocandica]RDL35895.1 hypothetical protein BP5553_06507 [Venustampulla echinocandica]